MNFKNVILSVTLLACGMAASAQPVGQYLPQTRILPSQLAQFGVPQRAIGDQVWKLDMDKMQDMQQLVIVDANGDNVGWGFGATMTSATVFCNGSATVTNDDWLFTPTVNLQGGQRYRLTYFVYVKRGNARTLEVKLGTDQTVDAMAVSATPTAVITSKSWEQREATFVIPETGNYAIGFHDVSEASDDQLYLSHLAVLEAAAPAAPEAAGNLVVTPAEGVAHEASIAFNAPAQTIDGNALVALSRVELLRNGNLVTAWTDVAAGVALSYEDKGFEKGGQITYSVIAYNESGAGDEAKQTVWIGYDVPKAPTDVTLHPDDSDMWLTWAAPTAGVNGYEFDPSKVWYNVYSVTTRYTGESALDKVIFATEPQALSQQLGLGIDEGEQRGMVCYAVSAENSSGEGPFQGSNYVLAGAPYELPFSDYFTDAEPETFWMGSGSGLGYTYQYAGSGIRWIEEFESQGCAFLNTYAQDTVNILSFKISLQGAEKPRLRFGRSIEGDGLTVMVGVLPAGEDHYIVLDKQENTTTSGVEYYEFALDEFKGARYIQLVFTAIEPEMAYDWKYVNIGDVSVIDASETAVETISAAQVDNDCYYDLQGRRVVNPSSGIYLHRGKKVIVR